MNLKIKIVAPAIILTLSFLVGIGHFHQTTVFAQATDINDKCHPIDLVILIDQSESMGGNATTAANDAEGQRFDAAVNITDYLANHSAWLCAEESIQHRVAVVGFGDLASIAQDGPDNPYQQDIEVYLASTIIPLENLEGMTQREITEGWGQRRESIETEIRSGANESLGATDHRSAFLAANDILAEWRGQPLGEKPRRQVVIMLTDGEPCVSNRGCPPQTYNLTLDLMGDLEEITNSLGDEFPYYGLGNPESVYISTIFLSRTGVTPTSQDKWEQITQSHGGDIYPVTSSSLLTKVINDALDPITGSGREPLECGEPKWVRPYLDNVIIFYTFPIVENPRGQAVLNIETDDENYALRGGVPITGNLTADDYLTFRGNESYIFNSPLPGRYYVTVPGLEDCTDELSLSVEFATISGNVAAPVPDSVFPAIVDPPHYSNALNSTFVLEMWDKNGEPLEEIDGYPLVVTATVRNGDYEKVYELDRVVGQNGRYETSSPIETPLPGNYTWDLLATVRHPDSAEGNIDVFEDDGSFRGSAVELMTFAIETPQEGNVTPLNSVSGTSQIPESLAVAVNVLDANGESIDVTQILADWSTLFEARLSDGTTVLETIELHLDPATKNRFVGQFENGSIDNLPEPGVHIITVETDWGGNENYNELTHAPATFESSVTVEQYEIKPLQLELMPPPEASLHQRDTWLRMFLKQNGLQPFPVSVRVVDPLNEDAPLFLNEVLNDLDSFEVVAETPSGITQTITLAESNNVAEQLLVGSGGELLDESGEYTLSIRVNDDQLLEEYAWAQTSYEETFTREDSTYTNPTTWTGVQVAVGLILLMVIIWLIYIFSGGPTGYLVIVDTGTKAEVISLKLRKRRRVNKFKKSIFKQVGIERITAQKGYGNLVSVHVKQADGLDAPLGEMEPGQADHAGNAEIRYINDRASATSY
ncbi:MAG: hypothetical protein KJ069_27385 [Anaerolineae bacterium]|nr:hypothetical protein [Anaerolineae bacterium]